MKPVAPVPVNVNDGVAGVAGDESVTAAPPAPGRTSRGLRGCRILGAVTLALLAVAELTPATEWLATRYAEPAQLAPADAIVVLGGGFSPQGWLDAASHRRLMHGILLYRQGLAPLLVLSGGTSPAGPSEPEIRARLAREMGVPPAAIFPLIGANTTREEAVRVSAELGPRGVRSILLVSGSLHLVRARAVFERQGFTVHPAPVEEVSLNAQKPAERLALTRSLAQELAGWLYYRVAGISVNGTRPGGSEPVRGLSLIAVLGLTCLGGLPLGNAPPGALARGAPGRGGRDARDDRPRRPVPRGRISR